MSVIYEGLKVLKQDEINLVKVIAELNYDKVKRDIAGSKLVVDVHRADKAGNRSKFSIHLRLDDPNLMLTAEESDWELATALHKSFDNLLEQSRKKSGKKTITEKKIVKD